MDEAGKMVSEDGTEVTVEGAVEDQEVEKDEDGQEVIKVYIFKADSGEDDMGESHSDLALSRCVITHDLCVCEPIRTAFRANVSAGVIW